MHLYYQSLFLKIPAVFQSNKILSLYDHISKRNIILNVALYAEHDKFSKNIGCIEEVTDNLEDENTFVLNKTINLNSEAAQKQDVPFYLTDKVIGAKTYQPTKKTDKNLYHQRFLKGIRDKVNDNSSINVAKLTYPKNNEIETLVAEIRKFPLSQNTKFHIKDRPDCQECFKIFQNVQKLPSVKTVLRETMTKESSMKLFVWRNKMIKDMGEENFLKYNRGLIKQGGKLHHLIELKYKGELIDETTIPEENKGHWQSLQNAFNILHHIDIHEKPMLHPHLGYIGIVDALGEYNGQKCAIEWKTSVKPKGNLIKTIDTPLQIAAYIGALNYDADPHFQEPIHDAIIVIAYQNGDPADIYHLPQDLTTYYWQEWLYRLSSFWGNKLKAPDSNL